MKRLLMIFCVSSLLLSEYGCNAPSEKQSKQVETKFKDSNPSWVKFSTSRKKIDLQKFIFVDSLVLYSFENSDSIIPHSKYIFWENGRDKKSPGNQEFDYFFESKVGSFIYYTFLTKKEKTIELDEAKIGPEGPELKTSDLFKVKDSCESIQSFEIVKQYTKQNPKSDWVDVKVFVKNECTGKVRNEIIPSNLSQLTAIQWGE
jgi:hypothetical protein